MSKTADPRPDAPQPGDPADWVVLYDGDCGLCNRAVRFLLRRDRRQSLRFAALQSAAANRLLRGRLDLAQLPDSLIVVAPDFVALRSTAVLRLASRLRWPWPLCAVGWLLPRPLRDWLYDAVARRRRRFFPATASCGLPEPGWRGRFLDE